jgi:sarcosine oxidase gamma subunit
MPPPTGAPRFASLLAAEVVRATRSNVTVSHNEKLQVTIEGDNSNRALASHSRQYLHPRQPPARVTPRGQVSP